MKKPFLTTLVTSLLTLASGPSLADNCYIMVHGLGVDSEKKMDKYFYENPENQTREKRNYLFDSEGNHMHIVYNDKFPSKRAILSEDPNGPYWYNDTSTNTTHPLTRDQWEILVSDEDDSRRTDLTVHKYPFVNAHNYWYKHHITKPGGDSFFKDLLRSNDNYAIVDWDSESLDHAFFTDEAAGRVAREIIEITSLSLGEVHDDKYVHPEPGDTRCKGGDNYYVISHSMGSQVMMFIAGNAYSDQTPWYNLAIKLGTPDENGNYMNWDWVNPDYRLAMTKIKAIFSVGGAVTGTQLADLACDPSTEAFITGMGYPCGLKMEYLQTYGGYTALDFFGGNNLAAPFFVIGGYGDGTASALLAGQDDGIVNLASQMSCAGSGKRMINKNLEWSDVWGDPLLDSTNKPIFTCGNDSKQTPRTYNLASIGEDHVLGQQWAAIDSPEHPSIDADRVACAGNGSSAKSIRRCATDGAYAFWWDLIVWGAY